MKLGFETIGNATLIAYDGKPILATDPWIQGTAYFGSWGLSHEIPPTQLKAILECPYVWISHGHPDHLNPDSIGLFKDKQILIADHFGDRLEQSLTESGFSVRVLPNKKWFPLSNKIKILTLADPGQDSILLVDINGTLIVNSNDCGENGWGYFLKKEIAKYPRSFLLRLLGYGDADMIHLYDEKGKLVCPDLTLQSIGKTIQPVAEWLGVTDIVPFSSQHRYVRKDSQWANRYIANHPDEYQRGFDSQNCKMHFPFLSFNAKTGSCTPLNPSAAPLKTEPAEDWALPLNESDKTLIKSYFEKFSALKSYLGFIQFKVAGEFSILEINPSIPRGITFECPRSSLVEAVTLEIFEDLLIGNFVKTTLHGDWRGGDLNRWFTPWVAKYGDNGRAFSESQLKAYFSYYQTECPAFRYLNYEKTLKNALRPYLLSYPRLFRTLKKMSSLTPKTFSPH